jgi:oligogalacturonide lyase
VTLADKPLMKMPPCSHLMSNADGTLHRRRRLRPGGRRGQRLGQRDAEGRPVPAPVRPEGGPVSRDIAHHDSSWGVYKASRQVTHPHPSFTPDERAVLFSADGDREPGLYLAALES